MASQYNIFCDTQKLAFHIIKQNEISEAERARNHYAALLIQRVWRGYFVRKEIRRLSNAATIIQKWVRRFLVQINMANYMLEYLEYVSMSLYNKMATKIQALWRGYTVRTKEINFSKMYEEKMRIDRVNTELKIRIAKTLKDNESKRQEQAEMESRDTVLFIMFKIHHLLRTHREGILSLHDKNELSWFEELLKSMKFTNYMKALRRHYNKTYTEPPERVCILKGRWRECEKAYYLRDRSKEVIATTRKPSFVQNRPFNLNTNIRSEPEKPSIRLEEKYGPAIKHIMRTVDLKLNISQTDFDLTMRTVEPKSRYPAYYTDFWTRLCYKHNLSDD